MRFLHFAHYLHGDHLGSTSLTTCGSRGGCGGAERDSVVARRLYHPYGAERYAEGALPTDFTFTGQRKTPGLGLMHYGARYYHGGLGRFVSADTIVPEAGNPQDFNRYAYVRNNPLRYTDPTGFLTEDQIMSYFDVQKWEEVVAFFERGGALEGKWGWLETLRIAELGDTIYSFENYEFDIENLPRTAQAEEMASWQGKLVEREGQLYIQSGETLVSAIETAPQRGNAYGVGKSVQNPMFLGPFPNDLRYYHTKFDFSEVDKVGAALDIGSMSADYIPHPAAWWAGKAMDVTAIGLSWSELSVAVVAGGSPSEIVYSGGGFVLDMASLFPWVGAVPDAFSLGWNFAWNTRVYRSP